MAFLLLLPIAYLILTIAFVATTPALPARTRWLGLAAVLAGAPLFYWIGSFGTQFQSGLCYSEVITDITIAVEKTSNPNTLATKLRALPLAGYETSCSDVKVAAKRLSGAAP
jgi:hypothetical protein